MVTADSYREAMARLGAAVTIVTSDGAAGRGGFTASAVCSVTDEPPTLLVCMNRGSDLNAAFRANGVLCVNVLSYRQEALSPLFGGLIEATMEERFAAAAWTTGRTGAPMLAAAAAAFDCRIEEVSEVGTHSVLFCPVQHLAIGVSAPALIYLDRAYHSVGAPR